MLRKCILAILCGGLLSGIGCSVAGPAADELNPYGEGNSVEVLGNRDNSAVQGVGGSKEAVRARQALEVLGSYQRARMPQPVNPVIRPAEVRMMWVPDHLNKHGDLVQAHYYFLRVMDDRWAVQDAFEIEQQLQNNTGIDYGYGGGENPTTTYGTSGGGSVTPWVYKEE